MGRRVRGGDLALDVRAGAKAGIDQSGAFEIAHHARVFIKILGLAAYGAFPGQSQPSQVVEDRLFEFGPAPAPVARVAGQSRWQLLLHGPAGSPLPLPSEAELRQGLPRDVNLAIDPDPLEL